MSIIDAAIPACGEDARRALIRAHPTLNGLDFADYRFDPLAVPGRRHELRVTFLKPPPALTAADLAITGGARVVGIGITAVEPGPGEMLRVFVTDVGDFSIYRLFVRDPSSWGIDPLLAAVAVNFKAGCPTDLDCRVEHVCPEPEGERPLLDHMVRDYASFRAWLLDFARLRNPSWHETHPAEPATALVELLAAEGDRLAWMQDAVGTEAYLETCRLRVSARRHARLVDYRMHDGRNAYGFVQLDVTAAGTVPSATQFLTRIASPLRGEIAPPGPLIPETIGLDLDADPAAAGATVFEATARTRCDPTLNRLWLHDFGGRLCCLPRGATAAYLYAVRADGTIIRPPLEPGDWLLLHEAKGPETGRTPDADAARRAAVRIESVTASEDPAFSDHADIMADEPAPRAVTIAGEAAMPLLRVTWSRAHAPGFALTITGRDLTGLAIPHAGQARGNLVPVDHGRTVIAGTADGSLPPPVTRGRTTTLTLPRAPLTFQPMPAEPRFDGAGRLADPRHQLDAPPEAAKAAAVLIVDAPGETPRVWRAVSDLLQSGAFDEHFVAELDREGRAQLRFGDDAFGRRIPQDATITARFRIGNGRAGNVGAGALVHAVRPPASELVDPADPAAPPAPFPSIAAVWQPLPARGGSDAETLTAVRLRAPAAMHARQFRAVTEADWEAAARSLPGVADARAVVRWTGSWHTTFIALHPLDQADTIALPGGGAALASAFAAATAAELNRWRIAGRDLAVHAAQYVPLKLELGVCLKPGYFRNAVLPEIRAALVGRGALFDPSALRFGGVLHLSAIVAAVVVVPGVSSCVVRAFHRYWALPAGELEAGRMEFGPLELPRLDADPSRPENGVLVLQIDGEG
jgi:ADP-ribose pyrophosphatase YjhB (NUDIX family)